MSLRGTAWEPERREAIPSVAAPAHRWGLYAAGDDGPVLLATAVERARLEVTRAAMGIAAELRELPRATARTVRGARGETHDPPRVGQSGGHIMITAVRITTLAALMLAGCALDPDDPAAHPVADAAVDAGEADAAPVDAGAGESDAGEPDATAPPPDANATCVAWVDTCHVRACPSGEVTERPDGTTCPRSACPTHGNGSDMGGACSCVAGACAWE